MRAARKDLLRAALQYRDAGLGVFPCKPGAKVPAIPAAHERDDPARLTCRGECGRQGHGLYDATTVREVIEAWWRSIPYNIGIPTGLGTFDVLDVDKKPEGNGFAALNKLIAAGLVSGASALVRTRSGGLHLRFAGTDQGCHSLPRQFIDFKSGGGYVLAPPSWVDADDKGPAGAYELLDNRAGTARLDWSQVLAVLDPKPLQRPRRPGTTRALPADGTLPPGVRRALDGPAEDRSAALHRLVGACLRAGLGDDAIHELAAGYEPAVAKYGDRLRVEVDRSMARIGAER